MLRAPSIKALALRAQTELLVDKDLSAFDRYWGEPYIQHNPLLPDGLDAVRAFMTRAVPLARVEIFRTLAEGDMVAFHQRVTLPDAVLAVFDIYRVEHGRFVEHWDAMEAVDDASASPFAGPTDAGAGDGDATRRRVAGFVEQVLLAGDVARAADHVADDLQRHGIALAPGRAGLVDELAASQAAGNAYVGCSRLLVEGDRALTVCSARIDGLPWTLCDLWRIAGDRIVEQWRVAQAVPDPATARLPSF
ncbi:MAG TPA: nuclear transport factor 2 family protein [Sphingomonas sp.]|nr:nuclear transport factor 2 family protein [Sphingomonas sp.]